MVSVIATGLPWYANGGTCRAIIALNDKDNCCLRGSNIYCSRFAPFDYSGMPNRVGRRAIIAQDGRYAGRQAGRQQMPQRWRPRPRRRGPAGRRPAGRAPPYIISWGEALCSPCVQTCPPQSSSAKLHGYCSIVLNTRQKVQKWSLLIPVCLTLPCSSVFGTLVHSECRALNDISTTLHKYQTFSLCSIVNTVSWCKNISIDVHMWPIHAIVLLIFLLYVHLHCEHFRGAFTSARTAYILNPPGLNMP